MRDHWGHWGIEQPPKRVDINKQSTKSAQVTRLHSTVNSGTLPFGLVVSSLEMVSPTKVPFFLYIRANGLLDTTPTSPVLGL